MGSPPPPPLTLGLNIDRCITPHDSYCTKRLHIRENQKKKSTNRNCNILIKFTARASSRLKVMLHGTTCNNDFSRNTASTFRAMLHESTFRATSYKMNLATCMLHETIFHATRLATFCVSKQRASRPCKQRWRLMDVVGGGVKTLLICFF